MFLLHSGHLKTSRFAPHATVPGDATVNQLTYFYNTFCSALDKGLEEEISQTSKEDYSYVME